LPRDVVLSGLITCVQILCGTAPLKFGIAKKGLGLMDLVRTRL